MQKMIDILLALRKIWNGVLRSLTEKWNSRPQLGVHIWIATSTIQIPRKYTDASTFLINQRTTGVSRAGTCTVYTEKIFS